MPGDPHSHPRVTCPFSPRSPLGATLQGPQGVGPAAMRVGKAGLGAELGPRLLAGWLPASCYTCLSLSFLFCGGDNSPYLPGACASAPWRPAWSRHRAQGHRPPPALLQKRRGFELLQHSWGVGLSALAGAPRHPGSPPAHRWRGWGRCPSGQSRLRPQRFSDLPPMKPGGAVPGLQLPVLEAVPAVARV